jgi:hypothetical protein
VEYIESLIASNLVLHQQLNITDRPITHLMHNSTKLVLLLLLLYVHVVGGGVFQNHPSQKAIAAPPVPY